MLTLFTTSLILWLSNRQTCLTNCGLSKPLCRIPGGNSKLHHLHNLWLRKAQRVSNITRFHPHTNGKVKSNQIQNGLYKSRSPNPISNQSFPRLRKSTHMMCLKLSCMSVMPRQVTLSGSIHNEWNERVQTGDPSPTPENARSVTGAIYRPYRFLLTRLLRNKQAPRIFLSFMVD